MKYRCYHFSNYFLSSIQHGIQAAHAQTELAIKYYDEKTKEEYAIYHSWATEDKTIICRNGGDNDGMCQIYDLLNTADSNYPWAQFVEPALDNLLTNICIIVPESLYKDGLGMMKSPKLDRTYNSRTGLHVIFNEHGIPFEYTEFEWKLMLLIRDTPMAI